jgi:hypothetical protein
VPRIIKNSEIEDMVDNRLAQYELTAGRISVPPIPVDEIIKSCSLKIFYDVIEEKKGERIFGGLSVKTRKIVINSAHKELFAEKPGLERSTKAHEFGHWDIFADKNAGGADLFSNSSGYSESVCYRNSGIGPLAVLLNAWVDEDVYQVYKAHMVKKDHPYVASAVDRYASSLLMPKQLITEYTKEIDLTQWKNLYRIRDLFGVTISALCVRLRRLGLVYVKGRKLYRTKEEMIGQDTFKFN